MRLELGDCLEKLKELPDNSVDSIVTDPPYGLGFMNKEWDSPEKLKKNLEHHKQKTDKRGQAGFSPLPFERYGGKKEGQWFQEWCEEWGKECLRVLKPGGHMLSFSAPRMYHRMTTGLEDAGFQIRDQIMWVFGSGFPKSHNIGKAVDKLQGNDREVLGTKAEFSLDGANRNPNNHREIGEAGKEIQHEYGYKQGWDTLITKGTSEWEGWGTALKPAHEPIVLARKPLSEKSVAENVLRWGTGGLNIDESRIGTEEVSIHHAGSSNSGTLNWNSGDRKDSSKDYYTTQGRWPANIIFDEEAGQVLDQQSGILKSGNGKSGINKIKRNGNTDGVCKMDMGYSESAIHYGDKGGASRFFYCPKASKKDRDEGMDGFKETSTRKWTDSGMKLTGSGNERQEKGKNNHPTVKPTSLMLYLIKLVTPVNGTVLDPFMGSGSTGKASIRGGFDFIGIEKEEEYMKISEARIKNELDGDRH